MFWLSAFINQTLFCCCSLIKYIFANNRFCSLKFINQTCFCYVCTMIMFLTLVFLIQTCSGYQVHILNMITPGRWQSKTSILSTNADQKSLETEFSIAICRHDKCQSKTRFLAIFDTRSLIVKIWPSKFWRK